MSELVANAFKHAFPADADPPPDMSGRRPKIRIEMRKEGDVYTVIVEDNGAGLPHDFDWRNAPGLGMTLVQSWAEHQLEGTMEAETRDGARFTVTFPD